MIITTTDSIPGYSFSRTIGFVSGNAVKSLTVAPTVHVGLKTKVGGEAVQSSRLMNEARTCALASLQENAAARGANAVVCVRLTTSEVIQGYIEVCAYGTAVVVR